MHREGVGGHSTRRNETAPYGVPWLPDGVVHGDVACDGPADSGASRRPTWVSFGRIGITKGTPRRPPAPEVHGRLDPLKGSRQVTHYCHIEHCEKPAHPMMIQAEVPLCSSHARAAYRTVHDMLSAASTDERVASASAPKRATRVGWKTEPGFVYFMRVGPFIKIGWSKDPVSRRKALGGERVLATMPGTQRDEKRLQMQFGSAWSHGEYFNPAPEILDFAESLAAA